MKKIRILSFLLMLIMLLSTLVLPAYAEPDGADATEETELPWADNPAEYRNNLMEGAPDYDAGSKTALLLEMNSGIVIYAKNAEETVYPASLTKIMTCMVALKYAGDMLDTMRVNVSESALAGIAEAGGEVRLKLGEQMTLRDALYYLMIVSSNEAANVIAEAVGHDIPTFVNMMNDLAAELGCTGTHFSNTHGLHNPNHYTTARDLSIITRAALTYETFREIVATPEYTVPATNLSSAARLVNTNYLILNDGNRYMADNGDYYTYYYDKATGVKTGYTSAAGRCVISRAGDGNLDLLCIIMGADTKIMPDGSTRYDNFVEAKKLFNYGFQNFAYAKLASSGNNPQPVRQEPVKFSDNKRGVVLVPESDVSCLLPKEYDNAKVTFDYAIDGGEGLKAPLAVNQRVGTLHVYYDGTKVGEAGLITLTAVEEDTTNRVISDVGDAIKDAAGSGKSTKEKSFFQRLLSIWYILLLVPAILIVLLLLRNMVYRIYRKNEIKKRKAREAARRRRYENRDNNGGTRQ